MPIYEYRCSQCGEKFESFTQTMSSGDITSCPACGSQLTDKLLTTPNIGRESLNRKGTTCCGREERCDKPPCSSGGHCHRG
jgi:putative FmdB family regulatory protein